MKRISVSDQRGFTILELMIATAVLSILLLVATGVFISISNIYTKGVNGTQLQDNVRNIMQQVTGVAQYSVAQAQGPYSNGPYDNEQVYCIGNEKFTVVIDKLQGIDNFDTNAGPNTGPLVQHVLWESPADSNCQALDLSMTPSEGTDLGIAHEGFHNFAISTGSGSLTNITVDAFEAPGDDLVDLTQGQPSTCKGNTGDQFCYTDQLETSAERRYTIE